MFLWTSGYSTIYRMNHLQIEKIILYRLIIVLVLNIYSKQTIVFVNSPASFFLKSSFQSYSQYIVNTQKNITLVELWNLSLLYNVISVIENKQGNTSTFKCLVEVLIEAHENLKY